MTGTSRTKEAPETPTFAELGVKGFDMTLWWGVVAPAGVGKAVQARLSGALAKVLSMPQIIDRMVALNIHIAADASPEALRKTIETDQVRFKDIATRAQLKAD
ncbi:Tripartite tricarboxylate transporter family receptor [compost metagenome]